MAVHSNGNHITEDTPLAPDEIEVIDARPGMMIYYEGDVFEVTYFEDTGHGISLHINREETGERYALFLYAFARLKVPV